MLTVKQEPNTNRASAGGGMFICNVSAQLEERKGQELPLSQTERLLALPWHSGHSRMRGPLGEATFRPCCPSGREVAPFLARPEAKGAILASFVGNGEFAVISPTGKFEALATYAANC